MAVVWAKSNGSWATTTLWAFWNETTQQIENYGQVPQVDDIVYLNGYVVQVSVATYTYLQVAEIHNDLNPYTEQIGGYVDIMNSIDFFQQLMITCDWFGRGANGNYSILNAGVDLDNSRRNTNITFVGNINNSYFRADFRAATSWIINGNVTNALVYMRHATTGASKTLTINGNVTSFTFNVSNTYENTLTINGNVAGIINELIIGNGRTKNCTINGSVVLSSSNLFTSNLQVNGIVDMSELATIDNITYPFANNCGIINYGDLTIKTTKLVDYPSPANVKKDIPYAFNQMVGTYDINQYLPPESVVLKDYEYGDSNDRKTGTMVQDVNVEVGCVTPEDVRKDVPLVGMGVVGTLVVPSVDDVREGVVFDNGSVGTLIVQGGGDRLRIADFGYYTNAQSDTYIVDLTEQDKPKFAVAEERVLIEMFPDLDLDNIPDKYFDDLFVKYLKYRLIVEYYRTAGINSTFTPSEPTTEIVNYQNVRNEVWLNSANIYLKAWSKKYPESIVKPQRILL